MNKRTKGEKALGWGSLACMIFFWLLALAIEEENLRNIYTSICLIFMMINMAIVAE